MDTQNSFNTTNAWRRAINSYRYVKNWLEYSKWQWIISSNTEVRKSGQKCRRRIKIVCMIFYVYCKVKGKQLHLYSALYISSLFLKGITAHGWYSFRLPTKGWPGWVDLGDWSHTEINVPHREFNPDTVTHLTTNRARRRLTSLI